MIDANEVTRELGVIFFDVVSAVVRFMRALYTFLSPHGARLFDPTFWRNIRDALVVGVRAYVAAGLSSVAFSSAPNAYALSL